MPDPCADEAPGGYSILSAQRLLVLSQDYVSSGLAEL